MAINEGVNLVSSSSSRSIPLGSISFYSIKTILKNILVSELSLMYIKISENIFSYQFDYNFFFSKTKYHTNVVYSRKGHLGAHKSDPGSRQFYIHDRNVPLFHATQSVTIQSYLSGVMSSAREGVQSTVLNRRAVLDVAKLA